MRIVFMGTPQFALPIFHNLLLEKHEIAAVYTQPDRPAGRGRCLSASLVKQVALKAGIKVVQPANLKSKEDAATELASFKPDVVVVAAYGLILPKAILDVPRFGCLNLHPSLLPRHRGASPIASAILNGDRFSGISIMLLNEGMDTGPVLSRAQIPISPQDTTSSLGNKLSLLAAALLIDVLVTWQEGRPRPRLQDESQATYSIPISKKDGLVVWSTPATVIWRRVRAYQPWPSAYTLWRGRILKIIEAFPIPPMEGVTAGRVVELDREEAAFGVGTGDGILGVVKVQLEGRQAMSAADFLRGQRGFISTELF